jgi:hypothetical protein
MKPYPLALGAFSMLLASACNRAEQKEGLLESHNTQVPTQSKPIQKPTRPDVRSIPASSDGALSILGIHPVSATLMEHPSHLLRLSCTLDHLVEGDLVARFLDGAGKERGRSQMHIKAQRSSVVLEFKIPSAVPIEDIASVQLNLPE